MRVCVLSGIAVNVARTVQSAVILFVVYVVPARVPPQVPPTAAAYPAIGVTVNCAGVPSLTVRAAVGLMLPFGPADGVTICVYGGGGAPLNRSLAGMVMLLKVAGSASGLTGGQGRLPHQPGLLRRYSEFGMF